MRRISASFIRFYPEGLQSTSRPVRISNLNQLLKFKFGSSRMSSLNWILANTSTLSLIPKPTLQSTKPDRRCSEPLGEAGAARPILHPPQDNMPLSETVSEFCPPIGPDECDRLVGLRKGIQGDSNSSDMDNTLFALFACTDKFDYVLHFEPADTTTQTKSSKEKIPGLIERVKIQKLLRENIIYPLRRSDYFSLSVSLFSITPSKLSSFPIHFGSKNIHLNFI